MEVTRNPLERWYGDHHLHFITCSCYRRMPLLGSAKNRDIFLETLSDLRIKRKFLLVGYVIMPEHVHLLVSEPERGTLAVALQMFKQITAHELGGSPFWQARYYDFNVWSAKKRMEKLKYIHRNPVKRGLVERPEDWAWSSFLHYATGVEGAVEIESEWTARRRQRLVAPGG